MKFSVKFLVAISVIFSLSCSSDTSVSPENNKVKDDFNYLTVNSSGKIDKIGNNSGKITTFSQFEGLTASPINLNTVINSKENIFLIEYYQGISKLFVFDKKAKITSSNKLVFPKEIVGAEPVISSLTWDESKKVIYGIIVSDYYTSSVNKTSYLVKIDPITFDVTYSGLSFDQAASISTLLSGNKLYSFSSNTYEIDVENNTAKKVLFNNSKFSLIKPAIYINATAFCLTSKANNGGNTIAKLNLENNTYEDLLPQESLGYSSQGAGYIDKNNMEYVCYLQKESEVFYLLKYNIVTNTYKYFELKSNALIDVNFIIVDKID